MTAATRSLRCFCHWQCSVRSPHRPDIPRPLVTPSVGVGVPDDPFPQLPVSLRRAGCPHPAARQSSHFPAGHTGPALQGVALSGLGGQGRPPLHFHRRAGCPHPATRACTAPLVTLRRGDPRGRPRAGQSPAPTHPMKTHRASCKTRCHCEPVTDVTGVAIRNSIDSTRKNDRPQAGRFLIFHILPYIRCCA